MKDKTKVLIHTIPRWSGGYLTHLKGILSNGVVPEDMRIFVHGSRGLQNDLGSIDDAVEFVVDNHIPINPFYRNIWRNINLPRIIKMLSPDALFSPDGFVLKGRKNLPIQIAMCRNLQPFLREERSRIPVYRFDRMRLEMLNRSLLRWFERADGVIFLSEYAREVVLNNGAKIKESIVVPHGIAETFRQQPKKKILSEKPVLLYISDFLEYKFQWNVARAIDILRKETKINFTLKLVGRMSGLGKKMFEPVLQELKKPNWLVITDYVHHSQIHRLYHEADLFIFASTVENFPNILLEAMTSGLPIACSNRRPMKDILGEAGVYFEPADPNSIVCAVKRLLTDDELRFRCAKDAYQRAFVYTWQRTASKTFEFIRFLIDKART